MAALQIEDRGVFLHGVVLVVDDADMVAILERRVVVERGKAGEIRPDRRLADPPIEVHDVGMIILDDLGRSAPASRLPRLDET